MLGNPGGEAPQVLVPLAAGAEEIETVVVADLLVRGGCRVLLAGVAGHPLVAGSRGILLGAHERLDAVAGRTWDLVYLPGGKGSAEACRDDRRIQDLAEAQLAAGRLLAAICAAPLALVPRGLCRGRRVTSFPGVRSQVEPHAAAWLDRPVVEDGPLVTSQGAGTALHLGLVLLRRLRSAETASAVAREIVLPDTVPAP